MHQSYRKYGRAERLTQYAIEIFDLVDIAPAANAERSVSHRFSRPAALSVAQYGEMQNVTAQADVIRRGK